jgi:fluoroacetyl-CoA thioesterase
VTDPAPPDRSTLTAVLRFTVTEDDTAAALGSGSLPVLATPRLLAWCEAATCAALEPALPPGGTSVGTRVVLEHLAASPVGHRLEITAAVAHVDGRLHRLTVGARHLSGDRPAAVVGAGEVTRVVVDAERFLGRVR